MIMSLIKLIVLIIVLVLLINHWDAVGLFFSNIINWVLYGMSLIGTTTPPAV